MADGDDNAAGEGHPEGRGASQQSGEHEGEQHAHGDADAGECQQSSQPSQRHHRDPEHDGKDDEWLPALDVGERVAGGGIDIRAGVVEHDVIPPIQLRHRGRGGHIGLQGGEGALVRPAGDPSAHAVALGVGVVAARTNLRGSDRGVDPIAITECLSVDGGVAAGPPHSDSHECRHDQDRHDTAHGPTDRWRLHLPAPQIVVMAVVMPLCHRASLCPHRRPRQIGR